LTCLPEKWSVLVSGGYDWWLFSKLDENLTTN